MTTCCDDAPREASLFGGTRTRALVLVLLFAGALALRLIRIGDPPLEINPTRQLFMALIARHYYFKMTPDIEPWRRDVMDSIMKGKEVSEPRIMQCVAALGYRALGGERLWLPRLFSIAFYLIGGAFLYALSRRIVSPDAATLGVAYYLFNPFAVTISRSFQPDLLMLMLMVAALWAAARYAGAPTLGRAAAAGLIGGAAIFVKPQAVFVVTITFLGLTLWKHGLRRGVFRADFWVFGLLSVVPAALYISYQASQSTFFGQAAGSFLLPSLWLRPVFWARWIFVLGTVVGPAALLGGIAGWMLLPRGLPRALLLSALAGYLAFAFVCTFAIHTHNYYTMQLVPIVAPALGAAAERLLKAALATAGARLRAAATAALVVLAIALSTPLVYRDLVHRAPEHLRQADAARQIGRLVQHSTRVLMLTPDFGEPLHYYGEIDGPCWPDPNDYYYWPERFAHPPTTREQLDAVLERDRPDWFVCDSYDMMSRQRELRAILYADYPLVAQTADFVIFDLRRREKR